MKIGYSLLLNEIVEAAAIEYGDCSEFQVVCPACSEAVFKVARPKPDGSQSHYLAHYKADPALAQVCENRVASLSKAYVEALNAQTRGQTIERYMAVLKEVMVDNASSIHDRDTLWKMANRTSPKKGITALSGACMNTHMTFEKLGQMDSTIERSIASFPRYRGRSLFWQREQAKFVAGVIRHLRTPQVSANMRFLVSMACINVLEHKEGTIESMVYRGPEQDKVVASWAPQAIDLIETVVDSPDNKYQAAELKLAGVRRVQDQKARARAIYSLRSVAAIALYGPTIGILAAVPFSDLLKDVAARKEEDVLAMLNRIFDDIR